MSSVPSERGLRESAGIMVNYEYTPASIERNHSAYVTSGQICAAPRVWGLVRGGGGAAATDESEAVGG